MSAYPRNTQPVRQRKTSIPLAPAATLPLADAPTLDQVRARRADQAAAGARIPDDVDDPEVDRAIRAAELADSDLCETEPTPAKAAPPKRKTKAERAAEAKARIDAAKAADPAPVANPKWEAQKAIEAAERTRMPTGGIGKTQAEIHRLELELREAKMARQGKLEPANFTYGDHPEHPYRTMPALDPGVDRIPATTFRPDPVAERERLFDRCRVPGAAELAEAAKVFRAAAEALDRAVALAERCVKERWPLAAEDIDDNLADRFEGLVSHEDIGARWSVEELKELATELEPGPAQGLWIQMVVSGRIAPSKPKPTAPATPAKE